MLGKRLRPPVPEPIVLGERAGFPEAAVTSPNRWCQMEGIGLGIVAALGKSCPPQSKVVLGSPKVGRPGPISVACVRNPKVVAGGGVCEMGVGWTDSESYTCVTCRGPQVQSPVTTRVYYNETEISPRCKFELLSMNVKEEKSRNFGGVFWPSTLRVTGDNFGFPTSDFLSYCDLCRKKLHGEDIYMYRGEKAFCSVECRYQQIISDEYQETCGSEISRASDVAVSTYAHDKIFLPGIVAA